MTTTGPTKLADELCALAADLKPGVSVCLTQPKVAEIVTALRRPTPPSDVAKLREALLAARNVLANSDAESGYCMCGDPVDSHNIGSGHAPVDGHVYMAGKVIVQIDEALASDNSSSRTPDTREAAQSALDRKTAGVTAGETAPDAALASQDAPSVAKAAFDAGFHSGFHYGRDGQHGEHESLPEAWAVFASQDAPSVDAPPIQPARN